MCRVVFAENPETRIKTESDIDLHKKKTKKQIKKTTKQTQTKQNPPPRWKMFLYEMVNRQICNIGLVYKSISNKMAYARL